MGDKSTIFLFGKYKRNVKEEIIKFIT